MRFKYQKQLDKLSDCPPSSYKRKEMAAYRIVFEDLSDEKNFQPALIQKPKRKLKDNSDRNRCKGYGLSLFDKLENTIRHYLELKKRYKNIHKTIGTHVATGRIKKTDGIVSRINTKGHFTLHEFENADLQGEFQIVVKIYNGKN